MSPQGMSVALYDLFRVRDLRGIAATCGGWGTVPGDLGRWWAGVYRCCPLRSGRSWPGCGPAVAPAVHPSDALSDG